MQEQCFLHRISQALQRKQRFGICCVASPVTAKNALLAVEEEDGERLIVVKLEDAQIGLLDLSQADKNEVISDVADLVETNNLLVEFAAVRSGDAAEDQHDGFVLTLCGGERVAVVAGPEVTWIAS